MFSALADNSSDKLSNINVVEVDAGSNHDIAGFSSISSSS